MAAGRAAAFVFEEDLGRGVQRLFQAARPEQRRRPPQLVDIADRLGNFDPPLGRDLLLNHRHRKQRRQVIRTDRLHGPRMERRWRRFRQIGDQVVPGLRDPVFAKQILHGLAHGLPSTQAARRTEVLTRSGAIRPDRIDPDSPRIGLRVSGAGVNSIPSIVRQRRASPSHSSPTKTAACSRRDLVFLVRPACGGRLVVPLAQ